MKMTRVLAATAFATAIAVVGATAQQQQTQRVLGQIEGVDGPTLVVKTKQGETKVNITPNVAVFGVAKETAAGIKKNDYIGVGAQPQADGTLKAIRVMVFAESQRGTGEGHRPWTQPGTTMTNATVDTTVASVDGQRLVIKYKDGAKTILIVPETRIMRYAVVEKSELKPGANIAINAATVKPDGTLEANRINVGRGDIIPD